MSANPGQIDGFLKKYGSPMAGLGSVFVGAGKKYGVDPTLLVGISGIESSFGKHIYGNFNAWGWGPGKPFGSWEQGISTVAQGLRSGYILQGLRDPYSIARKYAPSSDGNNPQHWGDTVSQFMRELGSSAPQRMTAGSKASPVAAAAASTAVQEPFGLRNALISNLSDIGAHGGRVDSLSMLQNIMGGLALDRASAQSALPAPVSVRSSSSLKSYGTGSVKMAAAADRPGVSINPAVVDFVRQVSSVYGKPLEIGTGTNHRQYVINTNRQSAHWTGNAADIPATGAALTALGRAALVAAGMPPAQAAKQRGGVFNLNGYQVLFNTMEGGNHWNHLHVGLRG